LDGIADVVEGFGLGLALRPTAGKARNGYAEALVRLLQHDFVFHRRSSLLDVTSWLRFGLTPGISDRLPALVRDNGLSSPRQSAILFSAPAGSNDTATSVDVVESILNAVAIYKTLRSRSPLRTQRKEYLYVIQSPNLDGLAIYSKGKLVREPALEIYYFLVSSKRAL
jgi:hypothetical protein